MKAGALGAKVQVSGRLDGSEIARVEKLSEGKIPLHTLRAHVDYGRGVAKTTYGVIGIKVWVYRGDVGPNGIAETAAPAENNRSERPRRGRRPMNQNQNS
jgi:small subunit ribosomal protein S3